MKIKGTAFDRLLDVILPDLLSSIGCAESGKQIRERLGGDEDPLIDALDNASVDAIDNAAVAESVADKSERVGAIARHLAQHLALEIAAPERSAMHLGRALEIAAQLGCGVGPIGVVA